jgi:hypothetical protein
VAGWLFAAAVAIRLAALVILGLHPESYEYERQARSLLAGEGYRYVHLGTPHLVLGPPLFRSSARASIAPSVTASSR